MIVHIFNVLNPTSFCLIFILSQDKYSTNLTFNLKSINCVLETRTLGGRLVGEDESTQL